MKKSGLLFFLFILFSNFVFACDIPEAEFIGKVINARTVTIDQKSQCVYNIDFTFFSSSNECPLVIGQASSALFFDTTCALKNGDLVSGILSLKNDQLTY